MKKFLILFLTLIFICSFCACGSGVKAKDDNTKDKQELKTDLQQNSTENSQQKIGALQLLCNSETDSSCSTENGYYYLTENTEELQDGNYGSHLMYMDFASCREIYLCSTAGCKHNSPDCPAVFLYDDFPPVTTKLFVYENYLYILSREYDSDGSMSQDILGEGDYFMTSKDRPAVLYRANLDGTERKKVYTFDLGLTLEEFVLKDENGIYVITKKLSIDKKDTISYTTSTERKLMFLDMKSFRIQEICSMDFDDNISWNTIGCYQNYLILNGMDYGRELSLEEKWNDDIHKSLYENAFDVYAILDLKSGKLREFYRESSKNEHSVCFIEDTMYISFQGNPSIEGMNIESGEKRTIGLLEQNLIMDVIGDTLCCRDWDLTKDATYYFVNTKTGEITHSTLVNQCNGWALEFRAETLSDMLVIYDYDATKNSDNSYSIHQYKYALISKEDLFVGKHNYRKINMIESGQ